MAAHRQGDEDEGDDGGVRRDHHDGARRDQFDGARRAQASPRPSRLPSRLLSRLLPCLRAALPALASSVAAFCCVFGWAVFRGQYLVGGDVFFYTYPLRAAAWRMIREGTLPVWTPHVLSGFPLLAMPQLGLGYPLTWGHLFLPPRLAEQFYIFVPFLLAPAFVYLFCRELRRTRTASVLAGLAFAYGGFATNGFGMNGLMPNAVMWLPLFLIAVERARTRPFARCLTGATIAYSMSVLTGFAQGFIPVALVALSYSLFLSLLTRDPARADEARLATTRAPLAAWAHWRPAVVASAAVALAAGVGAFQILETLRAQRRSIRHDVSFEFFAEGAFTPLEALRSFAAPPYHFIEVTTNVAPLAFLLALFAVALAALRLPNSSAATRQSHAPTDAPPTTDTHATTDARAAIDTRATMSAQATTDARAATSAQAKTDAHAPTSAPSTTDAWATASALSTTDVRALFWAALALLAFLLMLGDSTPLARLVHRIPVLGQMRRPSRHAFEWTFAVAVLSAYGFDALAAFARTRLRALRERLGGRFAVALAVALLAACAWLAESWYAVTRSYPHGPAAAAAAEGVYLRWKLAFVCCALAALAACLLVASRRWRAPLLAALVLVSSLAEPRLLVSVWWPGTIKTAARLTTPAQTTRLLQSLPPAENRVYVRANSAVEEPSNQPRFDALDLTALYGLHNVAGYEPLLQARYSRALGDVDFDAVTPRREPARNLSLFATRSHVLDLLNTTHVVAFADLRARPEDQTPLPPEFASGTRALDPARWQTAADFDGVVILRNLRALPRAWLVAEAEAVDGEEALRRIRGESPQVGGETEQVADESARGFDPSATARDFDPHRTALLEVRPDELPALPGGEVAAGSAARVVSYEANSLMVETDAPTATLLVVSEMFYPGWEATVDGRSQPILLTNYLLRGVALPAGKHRVEMRYRAPAARNGAIISGLSLASLIALALISRRRAHARKT